METDSLVSKCPWNHWDPSARNEQRLPAHHTMDNDLKRGERPQRTNSNRTILEENTGNNVCNIGLGNYFLGHNKAQPIKEKNDKLDLVNIKKPFLQKTLLRKRKNKPKIGRKYLQVTYQIRDSYPKHRKDSHSSFERTPYQRRGLDGN